MRDPDFTFTAFTRWAVLWLVQFFALAAIAFALLGWAVALNPQA